MINAATLTVIANDVALARTRDYGAPMAQRSCVGHCEALLAERAERAKLDDAAAALAYGNYKPLRLLLGFED
jgi:hypothetical protein